MHCVTMSHLKTDRQKKKKKELHFFSPKYRTRSMPRFLRIPNMVNRNMGILSFKSKSSEFTFSFSFRGILGAKSLTGLNDSPCLCSLHQTLYFIHMQLRNCCYVVNVSSYRTEKHQPKHTQNLGFETKAGFSPPVRAVTECSYAERKRFRLSSYHVS